MRCRFLTPESTMVAAQKTGSTHESINNRLTFVMKRGKYTLGCKTLLKTIRSSKAKLATIANNCPPIRKSEIRVQCYVCRGWSSPLQRKCVHVIHYIRLDIYISLYAHKVTMCPWRSFDMVFNTWLSRSDFLSFVCLFSKNSFRTFVFCL
ncbi:large ribosomal subunit protein eL30-like isoform X1 [Lycium ferocissimum]|uniref:large ribosomal subunit protein eL30-like isoform X1 n=1 Tax=Lycium ferocissimum TaxID=112874 RepID=UPI002814A734|nr:large ribosomal subunit protein eL30-like isoform X1 [Lycium ferocissimum]